MTGEKCFRHTNGAFFMYITAFQLYHVTGRYKHYHCTLIKLEKLNLS